MIKPQYPKRVITLLAGDTVYWDYTPLEEPSKDDEDFEYDEDDDY